MSPCSSRLMAAVAVFSSLAVLSAPVWAKETGEDRPVKTLGGAVHADPFTGVATTSIPIEVPPGRNGMQPSLALTYNSAAGNGWLGMGWDLEQEGIYRQSKWGVNYSTNTGEKAFEVKMAGVSGELVQTPAPAPSTQWSAKVEGGFSKIEKLTAGDGQIMWKVTTKQGRKHYFGQTAASRQVDPGNAANIFGWLLDRVEDLDGNYMTYSYQPDPIDPTNAQKYLQQIDYAGNGATAPTNTIKFWLDNGSRPDQADLYATNYRVKTKYRLKTVEVKANGGPVRAYELLYDLSPSVLRSRLSSVKVSGKDAGVDAMGVITPGTSWPATTFGYSSETQIFTDGNAWTTGWCSGGAVTSGVDFNGDGKQDLSCYASSAVTPITSSGNGMFASPGGCVNCGTPQPVFGDFNGDGRTDLFYVRLTFLEMLPQGPFFDVAWNVALASTIGTISSGDTWASLGGAPLSAINAMTYVVGDFSGDGKADLGGLSGATLSLYISNGAGSLSYTSQFSGCVNGTGDFNGDGKIDLWCRDGAGTISVATSTGSAFSGMGAWIPNWCASGQFGVGDFNGDGKQDLYCHPTDGSTKVALSTGASFVDSGNWATGWCATGQFGVGDFNGDGMLDVYCHPSDGTTHIVLSTGSSFVVNATPWFSSWCTTGTFGVGDFNGDGKADVYCFNTGTLSVARSGASLTQSNLLASVSTSLGDSTTLTYDTSANDVGNRVPFAVQRVKTISTCDNWNSGTSACATTPSTTTYSYTGGYYHVGARDLRGVNSTKVTSQAAANGDQTISETWFHQGSRVDAAGETETELLADANAYTKGLPYKSRVTDQTGKLYSESTATYLADGDGLAPYFTPQAIATTKHFNSAGVEVKQTQSEAVSYDAYGNLTLSYNLGDLSTGSDDTTTAMTYAPADTTNWLIGFPTAQRTYAGMGIGGTKLSEALTYYDGASSCTAPAGSATTVTKGHVTKVERWLNGGTNPISGMEYNTYGGVTCTRDPKGNTATLAYDPTTTFPLTSTNALGHVTTTSYYGVNGVASDTGLYGQAKTVTDPNGKTTTSTYDALGRKLTTTTPDGLVQTMAYNYGGAFVVGTQHVQSTTSGGGLSANLVSKTYFDGLGRTTKSEQPGAADGGGALKVLVTETQYDIRGLTTQTSLPYLQGTESATGRWRTMTYDAVGRLIKTTNPDNTSSQVCYNVWTTTSIDPKLHKKVETKDALGRLVTVQEYTGTGSATDCSGGTLYATTSYSYDLLGNLLSVTDTKGNISTMTYDTLTRKLTMHDPDMGNWSYTYDANGNLLTQVDAKNQKLCFSYDALNRRTQKNYGTTTVACGTNTVVYAYDDTVAANNGKGRLKQVTDPAQTVTFQYDSRGRIKQSAKTLDGTTYITTSAYDGLGRLTTVNYPTSPIKTVTYTYDGPQLKSVQEGATTYVTYGGWNALGQPATSTFGNGVVTTNTYANINNATCTQQSFRLCTLQTTMPGSGGSGSTVTFTPEADTFLHEDTPTTAYGGSDHVEVSGPYVASWRREAYLRFNITGLPVGATITSATLTLVNGGYSGSESTGGGTLYKFAPTDAAWVEGTPTWNARAGLAGSDASGALGSLGAVAVGQTVTFTNLQSVLSGNGLVTFAIKSTNEDGAGYYSKEWGTAGQRPVLSVTYTTGGTAGATHQDLRYSYEANGNVGDIYDATIPANAGDQHFAYDDLDRLTLANGPYGASGANASLTYAYDEIGNLTNNSLVGSYSYPVSGASSVQPHAVSSTGSGSGGTVMFTPEADTFLHEGVPTTSYGATDHVEVSGSVANAYRREAYLRFNITGLPVGATITSASLTLVDGGYSGSESTGGGTLYMFAPTDAAWVEGTPTWSARAGLAGSDASGALGSLGAVAVGQTVTFTNLQSVLSGNGRVTFAIKSTNEDGAGYYSKEWGTAGQRPVLSITYTTAGANTYSYDNNGNMLTGAGRTYTWNQENKPLTIVQGGITTTFVYDGDGGRVKKIVGTTTTRYISKLYECDNTNCSRFIWAGSTRIATIAVNTGAIQYWHGDHLGSSSVITDSAGAKAQTVTYYPFGGTRTNQSPSAPAIDVPYKYTGQELDSTGLYYYEARYYDPTLARFISADTIVSNPRDPQSLNRYSYVENNPLKYIDPTGHFKIGKFLSRAFHGIDKTLQNNSWLRIASWVILPGYTMNIDPQTRTQVWTAGAAIATFGGAAAAYGPWAGAIAGGAAGGFYGAAFQDGNVVKGAALGALAGAVSAGAGWVGGGLVNPDTGSYAAQIGKGAFVGGLKGVAVSLATNMAEGKIDTRGLLRSAAIGAVLGAIRPIALGKDVTDNYNVQAAIKHGELVYGRDFGGVRFVEGGILSGFGEHDGITLGGLINIDQGLTGDSKLLGHELWHHAQYQDRGLLGFQANYLKEAYVYGYHYAPSEVDARDHASFPFCPGFCR